VYNVEFQRSQAGVPVHNERYKELDMNLRSFSLWLLFIWSAPAQISSNKLTNEMIIKLVSSGVPAATIIKTIAASESVSFHFLSYDLQQLQQYNVPDDVVKAMAAKTYNRPMPFPTPAAEPAQTPLAPAQGTQNQSCMTVEVPSTPRAFLQSATNGTNWDGEKDQSMKMSKELEKECPGVSVTLNRQKADYTILLNQMERGLIMRDYQLQVANNGGDLISKTNEGGSIASSMKRACSLILADWTNR
jgi:hypothetical protein